MLSVPKIQLSNAKAAFQKLHTAVLLHQYKISKFKPKVDFKFDVGSLRVETASAPWQVEELLRMRKRVFFPTSEPGSIDVDDFDALADHLVVTDRSTDRILGTYRLLSSEFTPTFYSEGEFNLADFLSASGSKLELGRASVVTDARTGAVIHALWMGLARYMKELNPQYLFGCSSVMSMNPVRIKNVCLKLRSFASEEFIVNTNPHYAFPDLKFQDMDSDTLPDGMHIAVEPLLRTYLSAGAKVAGGPALDKEFQCVDFLTILDTRHINPLFRRKFLGDN